MRFPLIACQSIPVRESDGGYSGSVIPVAPGRMRNIFYPRRVAAYVSEEQLRDLRKREIPIERDFAFGIEKPKVEDSQDEPSQPSQKEGQKEVDVVDVQMDLVAVLGNPRLRPEYAMLTIF